MKFLVILLAILLTACGGSDPEVIAVQPAQVNTTDLHSTYYAPPITDTQALQPFGVVSLAGWPRYYGLPQGYDQELAAELSIEGIPLAGADLIVCIDTICQTALTDQDGYAHLIFAAPQDGWALGEHTWKIEYVNSTPAKVLQSRFVVLEGE